MGTEEETKKGILLQHAHSPFMELKTNITMDLKESGFSRKNTINRTVTMCVDSRQL